MLNTYIFIIQVVYILQNYHIFDYANKENYNDNSFDFNFHFIKIII
jgi:hypothetical protein